MLWVSSSKVFLSVSEIRTRARRGRKRPIVARAFARSRTRGSRWSQPGPPTPGISQIQIAVIDMTEHAFLDQCVQRIAIHNLAGGIRRALDRDVENIIVPMAEGIIAFAVQARVLLPRQRRGVQAMRSGEAIAARQSSCLASVIHVEIGSLIKPNVFQPCVGKIDAAVKPPPDLDRRCSPWWERRGRTAGPRDSGSGGPWDRPPLR